MADLASFSIGSVALGETFTPLWGGFNRGGVIFG